MKSTLILLHFLVVSTFIFGQHEAANTINGILPGSSFGTDVGMNAEGTRIVVCAPFHNGVSFASGRSVAYERNEEDWVQLGDDFLGTEDIDYGNKVEMSDDGTIIALYAIENSSNSRTIETYRWDGVAWLPYGQKLTGQEARLNDDGSYIISSMSGSVWVHRYEGGQWVQVGSELTFPSTPNEFGWDIDLNDNGDRIIISNPLFVGPNGPRSGMVNTYALVNDEWEQLGETFFGPDSDARTGWQVRMSSDGNTIAIATTTTVNENRGSFDAYTFGSDAWTPKGSTFWGLRPGDRLGWSMDMSADGNHIVISNYSSDIGYNEAGQTLNVIFLNGEWALRGFEVYGTGARKYEGNSVAISDDGTYVLTAAPGPTASQTAIGTVRLLEYDDIYGRVYNDYNYNCASDHGLESNINSRVVLNPGDVELEVDSFGYWYVDELADGEYSVTVIDTANVNVCMSDTTFSIQDGKLSTDPTDIARAPYVFDVIKVQAILSQHPSCDSLLSPIQRARSVSAIIMPDSIPITSNQQGEWTITNLDIGDYYLKITDEDYVYPCGDTVAFSIANFNKEVDLAPKRIVRKNQITGRLFNEAEGDCIFGSSDVAAAQVLLKLKGFEIYTTSDENGEWALNNLPIGAYEMVVVTPDTNAVFCDIEEFAVTNTTTIRDLGDMGIIPNRECTYTHVNVSSNRIRPCFDFQRVDVLARNRYFSVDTLRSPYIIAELDPRIRIDSSSVAYDSLSGNTYRFDLEDLAPDEEIKFRLWIMADCEAPVGATLCSDFTLFPLDSCSLFTVPEYPSGVDTCFTDWDGSNIVLSNECLVDSIRFTIKNDSPHDMTCHSPITIYENEEVILQDSILLNGMDSVNLFVNTVEGMYRMEVSQHPRHPGLDRPISFIENCGDVDWVPELIDNYYLNDANAHVDTWCRVLTGSFDPNDKEGFPGGVGDNNIIGPNIPIEYRIRFQNTGNDTAFNVFIIDTIDTEVLNLASFQSGSASHEFTYSISEFGIITYRFDNIFLPDSNVNLEASNGYFTFTIDQKPDLPDGTLIPNFADIYFDFNEPIRTNTYVHTVDRQIPLKTSVTEVELAAKETLVEVYPNPINNRLYWRYTREKSDVISAQIVTITGAVIQTLPIHDITDLPLVLDAGVYFVKFLFENGYSEVHEILKL